MMQRSLEEKPDKNTHINEGEGDIRYNSRKKYNREEGNLHLVIGDISSRIPATMNSVDLVSKKLALIILKYIGDTRDPKYSKSKSEELQKDFKKLNIKSFDIKVINNMLKDIDSYIPYIKGYITSISTEKLTNNTIEIIGRYSGVQKEKEEFQYQISNIMNAKDTNESEEELETFINNIRSSLKDLDLDDDTIEDIVSEIEQIFAPYIENNILENADNIKEYIIYILVEKLVDKIINETILKYISKEYEAILKENIRKKEKEKGLIMSIINSSKEENTENINPLIEEIINLLHELKIELNDNEEEEIYLQLAQIFEDYIN